MHGSLATGRDTRALFDPRKAAPCCLQLALRKRPLLRLPFKPRRWEQVPVYR